MNNDTFVCAAFIVVTKLASAFETACDYVGEFPHDPAFTIPSFYANNQFSFKDSQLRATAFKTVHYKYNNGRCVARADRLVALLRIVPNQTENHISETRLTGYQAAATRTESDAFGELQV